MNISNETWNWLLIGSGLLLLLMMLAYPLGYDELLFMIGGEMTVKRGAICYRDFLDTHIELYAGSYPWMVNRGLFMTPGDEEQWTLSVQHTDADVDRYVDAYAGFAEALTR